MLIRSAEQDIERVLYTEKAIAARVEEIGTELTKKLGDKRPVLVCVLKGASFFYIDLCRCIQAPDQFHQSFRREYLPRVVHEQLHKLKFLVVQTYRLCGWHRG